MDSQTTTDERAGFWMRAGAYMIDGLLASFLGVLAILLLATAGLETAARFAPLIITAAYFTVLPVLMAGQTPAKRLAGLAIERRDGEPMTYGKALLRWVGYMLSVMAFGLGFLAALFTDEHRALQDYVAGTRVVRREAVATWRKVLVTTAGVMLPLAAILGLLASVALPGLEQAQRQAAAQAAAAAQASQQAGAAAAQAEGVSSPSSLPDRSSAR